MKQKKYFLYDRKTMRVESEKPVVSEPMIKKQLRTAGTFFPDKDMRIGYYIKNGNTIEGCVPDKAELKEYPYRDIFQ